MWRRHAREGSSLLWCRWFHNHLAVGVALGERNPGLHGWTPHTSVFCGWCWYRGVCHTGTDCNSYISRFWFSGRVDSSKRYLSWRWPKRTTWKWMDWRPLRWIPRNGEFCHSILRMPGSKQVMFISAITTRKSSSSGLTGRAFASPRSEWNGGGVKRGWSRF